MAELSGRQLLNEWQKVMDSVVGAAGSAVPQQLAEPMQRQLELVQEIVERERRLQKELAGRIAAPLDAVFDLLEESAEMLSRQAEAIDAAAGALQDAAALMKTQSDLFTKTVATLREPTELAKSAAGLERRPRKRGTEGSEKS